MCQAGYRVKVLMEDALVTDTHYSLVDTANLSYLQVPTKITLTTAGNIPL